LDLDDAAADLSAGDVRAAIEGQPAELFSADALYAWGPFEELRGRNAIRGRWAAATADR
jgi:hypothetical protein